MKVEVQRNFIIVIFKIHNLFNFMSKMIILQNLIVFVFLKLIMDNGYHNYNKFPRMAIKLIIFLKKLWIMVITSVTNFHG